jgi:hypothetical protein
MLDEIPKGDLALYVFLEMIALGFALAAVDSFVGGKPYYVYLGSLIAAIFFFVVGINSPALKAGLLARIDRLPSGKTRRLLTEALAHISKIEEQLKETTCRWSKEVARGNQYVEQLSSLKLAEQEMAGRHQALSERDRLENLFLKSKVSTLENELDARKAAEQKITSAIVKTEVLALQRSEVYNGGIRIWIKNQSSEGVNIWTPLWENSTGQVLAAYPLVPLLFQLQRIGEAERFSPVDSMLLEPNGVTSATMPLLSPSGDGLSVRLNARDTGTMLFPLKVAGKLRFQRIVV